MKAESSDWGSVDPDEEEVLRTQHFWEKLKDDAWDLFLHFNDRGVATFYAPFRDMFEIAWEKEMRRPGRWYGKVTFLARVCGVHKSTMSRYFNTREVLEKCPGWSQNDVLRFQRWFDISTFIDTGKPEDCRFKGELDRRMQAVNKQTHQLAPAILSIFHRHVSKVKQFSVEHFRESLIKTLGNLFKGDEIDYAIESLRPFFQFYIESTQTTLDDEVDP